MTGDRQLFRGLITTKLENTKITWDKLQCIISLKHWTYNERFALLSGDTVQQLLVIE